MLMYMQNKDALRITKHWKGTTTLTARYRKENDTQERSYKNCIGWQKYTFLEENTKNNVLNLEEIFWGEEKQGLITDLEVLTWGLHGAYKTRRSGKCHEGLTRTFGNWQGQSGCPVNFWWSLSRFRTCWLLLLHRQIKEFSLVLMRIKQFWSQWHL